MEWRSLCSPTADSFEELAHGGFRVQAESHRQLSPRQPVQLSIVPSGSKHAVATQADHNVSCMSAKFVEGSLTSKLNAFLNLPPLFSRENRIMASWMGKATEPFASSYLTEDILTPPVSR